MKEGHFLEFYQGWELEKTIKYLDSVKSTFYKSERQTD